MWKVCVNLCRYCVIRCGFSVMLVVFIIFGYCEILFINFSEVLLVRWFRLVRLLFCLYIRFFFWVWCSRL